MPSIAVACVAVRSGWIEKIEKYLFFYLPATDCQSRIPLQMSCMLLEPLEWHVMQDACNRGHIHYIGEKKQISTTTCILLLETNFGMVYEYGTDQV